VLFVTHDIREAVFLANRIVVRGSESGRHPHYSHQRHPHPRDLRSPAVQAPDRAGSMNIITRAIIPDEDAPGTRASAAVEPLPQAPSVRSPGS